MAVHWKGIIALLTIAVSAFAVILATQSVAAAIAVFLLGLCLAFVIVIAWMRAPGHPKERHERHDRYFNDMSP